jgi:hypothetical protein
MTTKGVVAAGCSSAQGNDCVRTVKQPKTRGCAGEDWTSGVDGIGHVCYTHVGLWLVLRPSWQPSAHQPGGDSR